MSLISYSQNFEDVLLWRALKHVERGFYIDVGANDPTADSVTRTFYDHGWHGINIEPMQQYFDRLCAERGRDINLLMGVADTQGTMTFFDVVDTGLSTMDKKTADQHAAAGRQVVERQVNVARLADVCAEHVHGPIHFLKVDVEGFEATVLRGMDFKRWRPWILVIEATLPGSQDTNHDQWEQIVLDADYQYVYFDGLNRYYVSAEQASLAACFSTPPNVFDDFILARGHGRSYPLGPSDWHASEAMALFTHWKNAASLAESRVEQAMAHAKVADEWAEQAISTAKSAVQRMRQLETREQDAVTAAKEAEHRAMEASHRANECAAREQQALATAKSLEDLNRAIYQSTSWRVTQPLRAVGSVVWQARQGQAAHLAKQQARSAVGRARNYIIQRPALHKKITAALTRSPFLDKQLRSLVRRVHNPAPVQPVKVPDVVDPGLPDEFHTLPQAARQAYLDMQRYHDNQTD